MRKFIKIGAGLIAVFPFIASAAITDLDSLLALFNRILNAIVPILISLAVIYFLYGVFQYIKASGDPEARKDGISKMIAGIVGIFVMVSVWGLVAILTRTFGTNTTTGPNIPTLPVQNNVFR